MGWTVCALGFDCRRGLGVFLFTTTSRTALEPNQPPTHWVPRVLSPGVKRPGREADHSPPSSAEVENAWSYTSTPPVKHRYNFTFYLFYNEYYYIVLCVMQQHNEQINYISVDAHLSFVLVLHFPYKRIQQKKTSNFYTK
jgi:hypothetical protein